VLFPVLRIISHSFITHTPDIISQLSHVRTCLLLFLNYYTNYDDVLLVIHLSRDSVYKRMENRLNIIRGLAVVLLTSQSYLKFFKK